MSEPRGSRFAARRWVVLAVLFLMLLAAFGVYRWARTPQPLLIAPMIGGLDGCLFAGAEGVPAVDASYAASCDSAEGSAAALIEATLQQIEPSAGQQSKAFALGYTLHVPLLKLLRRDGAGWVVDPLAVERVARTVRDVKRPVILYLFSNHFSVGAPVETALAADAGNLLHDRAGPMAVDQYYGAPLYPWSFVDRGNAVTRLRAAATDAVLGAVCRLPDDAKERVRAVTLLGEVHHLFPRFESGMGYDAAYRVTDYSAHSVGGFREFLVARFGSVAALNAQLGADYSAFADVLPPARDIRAEALTRFEDHIDAFAHGSFPVSGWLHRPGSTEAPWIRIHVDGAPAGRVRAGFGRQDVLAAHPEFGTANLGWSFNLDYRGWAPGIHRIDVLLETDGAPVLLTSRQVSVMDRTQATPRLLPTLALAPSVAPMADLAFHVDQPVNAASYYYNPLVPLWHGFRATQVRDYLAHFGQRVAQSCLGPERAYAHQIFPFSNPGWDPGRFAVGGDLGVPPSMGLGVSLYGEASYGRSFTDWLARSGRQRYGITEFHPLRPMGVGDFRALAARHQRDGAQFLSFFVSPAGSGAPNSAVANPFSFDVGNAQYGSDVLRESVRTLLQ